MRKTKLVNGYPFVYVEPQQIDETGMVIKAKEFYKSMNKRRSIRQFSDRAVPREVVEQIILTASTAPSGAHKQPWTFCIVNEKKVKKKIRQAAEKEEYESYHNRMPAEWLQDLAPIGKK